MRLTVETAISIEAQTEEVWNLLCDARLPLTAPCCFKIGVPTPESCTLVSEQGEVGARRQCRTKQGVINQRITEWAPPHQLGFVMESDTLGLEEHLAAMSDTFSVAGTDRGCVLSRRTDFETKGAFALPKACVFRISVWNIHRYVMRNFKTLAEAA